MSTAWTLALVAVFIAVFVWWDVLARRRKLKAYAEAKRAGKKHRR
jgi:hypothetical protein